MSDFTVSRVTEFERAIATRIKQLGLPAPEREYKLVPNRRFRADFAWPALKIALEAEGGVCGWHQSIQRYETDCEKYSLAAAKGWLVIRCTRKHFDDGRVWAWLQDAVERRCSEFDWRQEYVKLHKDFEWQARRISDLEVEIVKDLAEHRYPFNDIDERTVTSD